MNLDFLALKIVRFQVEFQNNLVYVLDALKKKSEKKTSTPLNGFCLMKTLPHGEGDYNVDPAGNSRESKY